MEKDMSDSGNKAKCTEEAYYLMKKGIRKKGNG